MSKAPLFLTSPSESTSFEPSPVNVTETSITTPGHHIRRLRFLLTTPASSAQPTKDLETEGTGAASGLRPRTVPPARFAQVRQRASKATAPDPAVPDCSKGKGAGRGQFGLEGARAQNDDAWQTSRAKTMTTTPKLRLSLMRHANCGAYPWPSHNVNHLPNHSLDISLIPMIDDDDMPLHPPPSLLRTAVTHNHPDGPMLSFVIPEHNGVDHNPGLGVDSPS
ncbi:hypothetical protein H4582DRAFT_1958391 [Lactarius indigo]|nr:hypothetical protein H4582DRAFT_1958391 [Lactarius indigo]